MQNIKYSRLTALILSTLILSGCTLSEAIEQTKNPVVSATVSPSQSDSLETGLGRQDYVGAELNLIEHPETGWKYTLGSVPDAKLQAPTVSTNGRLTGHYNFDTETICNWWNNQEMIKNIFDIGEYKTEELSGFGTNTHKAYYSYGTGICGAYKEGSSSDIFYCVVKTDYRYSDDPTEIAIQIPSNIKLSEDENSNYTIESQYNNSGYTQADAQQLYYQFLSGIFGTDLADAVTWRCSEEQYSEGKTTQKAAVYTVKSTEESNAYYGFSISPDKLIIKIIFEGEDELGTVPDYTSIVPECRDRLDNHLTSNIDNSGILSQVDTVSEYAKGLSNCFTSIGENKFVGYTDDTTYHLPVTVLSIGDIPQRNMKYTSLDATIQFAYSTPVSSYGSNTMAIMYKNITEENNTLFNHILSNININTFTEDTNNIGNPIESDKEDIKSLSNSVVELMWPGLPNKPSEYTIGTTTYKNAYYGYIPNGLVVSIR